MRTVMGVLLLFAATLAPTPVNAQTAPCDQKTVTVTGSGMARLTPDRVSFTAGVATSAKTVGEAFAANNAKTRHVIDALKAHGVAAADVQTSNFSIDSPYDPKLGQKRADLFVVSNSVMVTVRNIAATSVLVQAAVDAGANQVANLTFSNSNPAVARDRAIELATADARAQAEKLAAAVGRTLGGALTVTTMAANEYALRNNSVSEAITVTASAPDIEAGSNTVGYSVTITYELK
jgi:uncharacterized protein YggE